MVLDPNLGREVGADADVRTAAVAEAMGDWAFSAQFFLVSATPQSGKTSFLQQLAAALQASGRRVGGVLAPCSGDGGRRQMILLRSAPEAALPLQLNDGVPVDGTGACEHADATLTDGVTRVGNFVFDDRVLERARAEIGGLRGCGAAGDGPVDWVLVDEVGPLELRRGAGLEPAIGELLRAAARGELGPPQPRFVIVVRPTLRDEAVRTYGLDGTGCRASVGNSEGSFFGFADPEARAAAVVDLQLPTHREAADALCSRLAGLPALL